MPIPTDQKRLLDALSLDRENIYRAFNYGRLYGRAEAHVAISNLSPVFGSLYDDAPTVDRPEIDACTTFGGKPIKRIWPSAPDKGDAT